MELEEDLWTFNEHEDLPSTRREEPWHPREGFQVNATDSEAAPGRIFFLLGAV